MHVLRLASSETGSIQIAFQELKWAPCNFVNGLGGGTPLSSLLVLFDLGHISNSKVPCGTGCYDIVYCIIIVFSLPFACDVETGRLILLHTKKSIFSLLWHFFIALA